MQAYSESHALWRAPFRGVRPIDVRVEIPGSKSVTNRALILAALANSPSTLRKSLHSRDSELMIAGLRALGAEITGESELTVTPRKLMGPASIDVGNAGTVMRFLPPVAALAQGLIHFDGDPRSHERPLAPVIKALASLGVTIEHGNRYSLPLTINGNGSLSGGDLEIDASASSQFVSALLLIGPATKNGITLKHIGASLPSAPHIEMTIQLLRDFGAEVVVGKNEWRVEPGKLNGQDLTVEPDLSNAAPFLSIAMVCGGSITIADWPKNTTQPGDQLRELLSAMGAKIEFVESNSGQDLKLTGNGAIKGIDVDLHDVGELTPAIAALAALADSPSSLRGIGHLRMHETDRLAALAREINGLGGSVKEEKDALHITPAPLHGGTFHTYDDHRLATTGAVIGLVTEGVDVENIETTRKTLPDFSGLWKRLVN
ncbi:MAG: 3-phosphoshikimate 1-carboxyvinyltransferase [Actinomycetes bacterium]